MLTRKQVATRNTHSIANDLKEKKRHSFTHEKNLEPRKLKIDMSLVQTITHLRKIYIAVEFVPNES